MNHSILLERHAIMCERLFLARPKPVGLEAPDIEPRLAQLREIATVFLIYYAALAADTAANVPGGSPKWCREYIEAIMADLTSEVEEQLTQ